MGSQKEHSSLYLQAQRAAPPIPTHSYPTPATSYTGHVTAITMLLQPKARLIDDIKTRLCRTANAWLLTPSPVGEHGRYLAPRESDHSFISESG